MEKITEKLKAKYKGDQKGKVYLFLIRANEIALANSYKKFTVDTGIRHTEHFVNAKLDSIFSVPGSGYWNAEYRGFDELLAAAKLAQTDINNGIYSVAVIDFIETAIKSYLPKGEKRVEEIKPQFSILKETHVSENITGDKLVKQRLQEQEELEEEEREEEEFNELDMSALDEEEETEEEDIDHDFSEL